MYSLISALYDSWFSSDDMQRRLEAVLGGSSYRRGSLELHVWTKKDAKNDVAAVVWRFWKHL